ncbi:MAG: hypothetical protein HY078_11740 [Elusimicrobia bacterium]|nr:hypothetical protein [Elusimicrobiota bacterium]
MSLGDWLDKYVISIGPRKDAPPSGEVDLSEIGLKADGKMDAIAAQVDESKLRAVPGLDTPFQKIYDAARIAVPEHKFTVEKIGEMLAHPKLASLAREAKAAAVLVALDAQGVSINSVLEDAVKKDRALDIFEKVQRDHLKQSVQAKEEENRRLVEEIEKVTREKQKLIEDNKKAIVDIQAKAADWLERKRAMENNLHEIVQHFTTDNPITIEAIELPAATVKITDLTQPKKGS